MRRRLETQPYNNYTRAFRYREWLSASVARRHQVAQPSLSSRISDASARGLAKPAHSNYFCDSLPALRGETNLFTN